MLKYHRYQVVSVQCKLYEGNETVEALTLMAAPGSLSGAKRGAGGSGVTGAVRPSKRYLDLLKDGERRKVFGIKERNSILIQLEMIPSRVSRM